MRLRIQSLFVILFVCLIACNTAGAVPIFWTNWAGTFSSNTANGTITTPTSTVNVTYTNLNGIAFFQTGAAGETDYWTSGGVRNPATSPYTNSVVDNIPTGTDIVALNQMGNQTLTFSEAIANPVFAYVSLNGNGYAFDRDFDILSFGAAGDPLNTCGFWGCGTSFKSVVDIGGGVLEYRLLGTGEPHGTLQFRGSFSSVTWRSLSSEHWNGFTVGVQGTATEVFPETGVPEPSSLVLLGTGLIGLLWRGRRGLK